MAEASLKLLPRKEFEITLAAVNGSAPIVIKAKFGTWATWRMCKKLGCERWELEDKFDPKVKDKSVSPNLDVYFELLLCSVEQKAQEDASPFSFTNVHAGRWIDELGGLESAEMKLLADHLASEVDEKKEKKTDEPAT